MDMFQILAADACGGLGPVVALIKNVLNIICILIPIALILMGSIDLGKAVLASDDKEIKAATGKLIKRSIAAVVIFLLPFLVNVIMGLVADVSTDSDSSSWYQCWQNQ